MWWIVEVLRHEHEKSRVALFLAGTVTKNNRSTTYYLDTLLYQSNVYLIAYWRCRTNIAVVVDTNMNYWRPIIGCHGSAECLRYSETLDWTNILRRTQRLQNQQTHQTNPRGTQGTNEMDRWRWKGTHLDWTLNWECRDDPHQWHHDGSRNVGSIVHCEGIKGLTWSLGH